MAKNNKKKAPKRDNLLKRLEEITQDPEVLRKAEEFHKKASRVTVEELLRGFTI